MSKGKFGVGQSAYLIYEKNGEHGMYDDLLVVRNASTDDVGDHYSLETPDEDIIDWCRGEDMFSSKAAALIEVASRGLRKGCENLIGESNLSEDELDEKLQEMSLKAFEDLKW